MFKKTSPIAAIPGNIWNDMPRALREMALKAKRKGKVYYHHTDEKSWGFAPPKQDTVPASLQFLARNSHTPGPYDIPVNADVITIVEKLGCLPVFYNAQTGTTYPLKGLVCCVIPFFPHEITQLVFLNSIFDRKKPSNDKSVNAYLKKRVERAFGK